MASDFPRERRLHFPHYSTMYEHTPSDPQKRRHETIRSIYLWSVPAEKRADRPRESSERQRNFETKYRHVLKDRADHEHSRKYYYPPADTKPTDSSHLGLVDRLLAEKRDEIAAYVPPSRAKKEAAAAAASSGSSVSPRTYGRDSSTNESPRERQRPARSEINHPAVEASRASRRLNSYLDDSKDVSSRSSTGRYDRSSSRRSTTADDSVASSSAPYSSSNGRSSRYDRSFSAAAAEEEVVASSSASRRSRSSSKTSGSSKPSKHAQAGHDSDNDDLSDFDVDAIVAEVMAQHGDLSSSDDEAPSDDAPAPEYEEVPVQVGEEIATE